MPKRLLADGEYRIKSVYGEKLATGVITIPQISQPVRLVTGLTTQNWRITQASEGTNVFTLHIGSYARTVVDSDEVTATRNLSVQDVKWYITPVTSPEGYVIALNDDQNLVWTRSEGTDPLIMVAEKLLMEGEEYLNSPLQVFTIEAYA